MQVLKRIPTLSLGGDLKNLPLVTILMEGVCPALYVPLISIYSTLYPSTHPATHQLNPALAKLPSEPLSLKKLKPGLCNNLEGWDGEEGERFKREGTCVHLWLIHVDVWQKPTQYHKAITLQLKIIIKNSP